MATEEGPGLTSLVCLITGVPVGTLPPMASTTISTGAHLIGGDWSTHAPGGTAASDNPARPDEPVGEFPQ